MFREEIEIESRRGGVSAEEGGIDTSGLQLSCTPKLLQ